MKGNFSIGVMTDSFKKPFFEALGKAEEVGAQGIQLYAVDGENVYTAFDDERVKAVTEALKEHGLVVSAVCGDFGGHGFYSEKENEWKIPASKQVALLAKKLGSSVVTTHIGCVPEDKTSPEYILMRDACRDMGDYAVWRATKVTGQYDSRTFEIKARPVDPSKARGMRPGMSAIYKL